MGNELYDTTGVINNNNTGVGNEQYENANMDNNTTGVGNDQISKNQHENHEQYDE